MTNIIKKISAGGIVHIAGKILALNVTKHSEIVFPKGTIENDESPEEAAIREIKEETGYDVKIEEKLGEVSYEFKDNGQKYRKTVYHFLFSLLDENQNPTPSLEEHENEDGIENIWLKFDDAAAKLTHKESKELLAKARSIIEDWSKAE